MKVDDRPQGHGAQLPRAPPAPSVVHHSAYAGAPPAAASQHQRAPVEPLPLLELKYEEDPTRALKGWPDKDCPKFTGAPGESAPDWLDTVAMLLGDRLAHPGIWHRVAGLRLSGKAFRDWKAALAAGTRPATWEQFRAWLLRLNPLGSTPAMVSAELNRLRQQPNEAVQLFYERFCDWQSRARTINFAHDEQTAFIQRLNPGLSKKVSEFVSTQTVLGNPVSMDTVFMQAVANDAHYREAQAAPVAGGSGFGKRRAEGQGGSNRKKTDYVCHNCKQSGHPARKCPEPKSDSQKAWEVANQAKKKEKKD